jgi:NAD+ diphosphatase
LDENGYFFQKNSLLLPAETSDSGTSPEMPLAFAENFPFSDVFSVPAIAGGGAISCVSVPPETPLPPFLREIPVRRAIPLFTEADVARMLRAFHFAQWRRESLFCGSCGGKNIDAPDEAARLCPACGRVEFPRITPAVITIITNGEGQALLAHNKKFIPGLYSLIAGFVEAGENLETAAAREIREEIGIEVTGLQYVATQPWPFPYSLMAGFSARYASGTITPDGIEIEDARWFSRDNLPLLPSPGSVAYKLIQHWIEEE